MGESPQRPGSFHARPLVVVAPDISPFSFNAEQLMVPCGGCITARTANIRRSGLIPKVAAALSISCSIFSLVILSETPSLDGFQLGSESPGPHQSWLE